jgi:signal peptidase I
MAAGMSLVLPGFGQLYNGSVNKGLLLFMAFTLATVPLVLWVTLGLPSTMTLVLLILTILINAGIWVYGIVEAWRTAKKSENYELKHWQFAAVYLMVFLVTAFFFVPSMSQYMRNNLVESFYVPSTSMVPSVLEGDILFANKNYNCIGCAHEAQRGDIAIFVYPNNRTQYYIKRIIGLPGDRISIRDQQVFVNSRPLTKGQPVVIGETNVITEQAGNTAYKVQWTGSYNKITEAFVVPNGEVFVLGDNRSNSKDSRHFGTVPLRDVVGKASQVWLSRGQDGFRWERFGLALK